MGIPTVAITGEVFFGLCKMYADLTGMPHHRIVGVPHPTSRVPAAECRKFMQGNDPITGRRILDEIEESLTTPLTTEDKRSGFLERPEPRSFGPDTEENLERIFLENNLTDKLPIVLPTEERVSQMLKGTSHKPWEVVGELRSGYEACVFTVEKVATNAVMAGARPEYLPVMLALASSGVPAITTSTQSFAKMLVVNGPIRNEIRMNSGIGALSPLNHANAVIGRAATLLCINLGAGVILKETYWGSQGNNFDYNHATFAENEEDLPAQWAPFHVQKGFKPKESAISLFQGYSMWHWKNTYENTKSKAILHLANWVLPSGAFKSGLALLLDPIVAVDLVNEKFTTKEALSEYVYKNTLLTLDEFWRYHLVEGFSVPAGKQGIEPYAQWLKEKGDTHINRYRSPEQISVLVVGGKTNDFWQGGDWCHTGTFSIDEWR